MAFFSKKSLGIDIGASSIKIVELSARGRKRKLENYLHFQLPAGVSLGTFDKKTLLLASETTAEIMQFLFQKLKLKEKKAALALPDFSSFFTIIKLPPMAESEIPQAVKFEARHHVHLALTEVAFDWQIVGDKEPPPGSKLKVLLVAVPNNVLNRYQQMARFCDLNLKGMEAEVFGLTRSAVPLDWQERPVCLVDFGWQSATVSIVEKNNLAVSHSFDISGTILTKALSNVLNVDFKQAEKLKKKHGLDPKRADIFKVISHQVNSLALEIGRVCRDFYQAEGRDVRDIILAGGTARMFGLKDYLAARLKKNVRIAEPFISLSYPEMLGERLKQIGPSFAVAIGVAMMGLDA